MSPLRAVPTPAVILCLSLLAVLVACGGAEPRESEDGPPAATYTVRGQVVTLPVDNGGEIRLAHEAIDDFVSASGEVVGMDAMTMSFPLAGDLDLPRLAVGDVVELDLRVDWSAEDPATVTRIVPLPAGTELDFGVTTDTDGE